jgi:hypothetical protein
LAHAQVQIGAVWDLLTAQCDRHAENVFIDVDGNIQLIDNDKALGVVRVGREGWGHGTWVSGSVKAQKRRSSLEGFNIKKNLCPDKRGLIDACRRGALAEPRDVGAAGLRGG